MNKTVVLIMVVIGSALATSLEAVEPELALAQTDATTWRPEKSTPQARIWQDGIGVALESTQFKPGS